jgi:hypothetical protein
MKMRKMYRRGRNEEKTKRSKGLKGYRYLKTKGYRSVLTSRVYGCS